MAKAHLIPRVVGHRERSNSWSEVFETAFVVVYLFHNIFSLFLIPLAFTFVERNGCVEDSIAVQLLIYQVVFQSVGCYIWACLTLFHVSEDDRGLSTVSAIIVAELFISVVGLSQCYEINA